MKDLSKMDKSALEKTIEEAQTELKRRESILQATKEIVKILNKHNLTADDIKFTALLSNSKSKSKLKVTSTPSKQKKARAKVPPKFKSLDSSLKWTGRGKSPRWVVALCEAEKLTIDAFKKDPRFTI